MTDGDIAADIAGMTFEQALQELEQIVKKLESGETDLDAAIGAYERGYLLKEHCERKLGQARERIEKIVERGDGTVEAQPVAGEDEPPF